MTSNIAFNEKTFMTKLHELPEEIAHEYILPKLSPETLV